ncbi:hypothetical protein QTV43_000080 [Vibrio vulnificus]|nr:hypothetical protein [Vibrio vulnificus]
MDTTNYKGYQITPCGDHFMIKLDDVVIDDANSIELAKATIDERIGDA